jgi:hypothetical protein
MKKFCVMMIAACVLAVSTANTVEASIITKRIEGVKKIANLVSTWTWKNKGSIAVGTVATVALTNPEAVKDAVTGSADVAYGAVTGGKTAGTVAPRANVRPTTTGVNIIPTLLFYLLVIVLVIAAVRYCLHSVGLRRVLPLLIVGVLLCFGVTAEASMLSSFPAIQCTAPVLVKPIAHFIVLIVTIASIFL